MRYIIILLFICSTAASAPCESQLDDEDYFNDPTFALIEAYVDNRDQEIGAELERRLNRGELPAHLAIAVFEALHNPDYRGEYPQGFEP